MAKKSFSIHVQIDDIDLKDVQQVMKFSIIAYRKGLRIFQAKIANDVLLVATWRKKTAEQILNDEFPYYTSNGKWPVSEIVEVK